MTNSITLKLKRQKILLLLSILICISGFANASHVSKNAKELHNNSIINLNFYDPLRLRSIHVVHYSKNIAHHNNLPVVILSHGHKMKIWEYSFIATRLANLGYDIFSIENKIAGDPMLPKTGDMRELGKPFRVQGAANIDLVLTELKKTMPNLNFNKLILIGHSNGADISIYYASKNPTIISSVISLDGLRMPFPTDGSFPILAIGSNDMKADQGVIPNANQLEKLKIALVSIDAKHVELFDRGPKSVQYTVITAITQFLKYASNE